MGKHTPTGAEDERTVASLTADRRAAAMHRHPAGRGVMRRAVLVVAAAGILAGTSSGIASAAPSPQSQHAALCFHHPDACENPNPYHPAWADVDPNVLRNGGHFTFWDRLRGVEKQLLNLF